MENGDRPSKRPRRVVSTEDENDEDASPQQRQESDIRSVDSNPDNLDEFLNEEDLEEEQEGEDLAENWLGYVKSVLHYNYVLDC